MDHVVITLDTSDETEIAWAIGKAGQYAKKSDKVIWVYAEKGLLYMTEGYPPEGSERVARCYPGGRNELHRIAR